MAEEQKQASTEPAVGGEEESDEQIVTPWTAHAAKGETTIDYEKLISKLSTVMQVAQVVESCNDHMHVCSYTTFSFEHAN